MTLDPALFAALLVAYWPWSLVGWLALVIVASLVIADALGAVPELWAKGRG